MPLTPMRRSVISITKVLMIYPGAGNDDIGYGRSRAHGALGERLSALGDKDDKDYFLDLRAPLAAGSLDVVFGQSQPFWIESQSILLNLAAGFDGVVWIKTAHTPNLPLLKLIVFGGLHHRQALLLAGAAVFIGIIGVAVYLVRKRKRARAFRQARSRRRGRVNDGRAARAPEIAAIFGVCARSGTYGRAAVQWLVPLLRRASRG